MRISDCCSDVCSADLVRIKDRSSSSEGSVNDSSSVPTHHWRVRALYTIRHVCCSSTICLSNHHQREDSMTRSAVKYMGTPFWAALRNSLETSNSTSASIHSLPSRTMGSTRTTRSPSCGKLTSACTGRTRHRTKASRKRNIDAYPYTYIKPELSLNRKSKRLNS